MTAADSNNDRVLLADIGGTNARFALMDRGEIGPVEHLKVADFTSATDAMAAFLKRHAAGATPAAAVLGVAGTVQNNRCVFTNSPWVIDGAELQQMFGFGFVQLLNDFEALALVTAGTSAIRSLPGRRATTDRRRTDACDRAWYGLWRRLLFSA